MVKIYLAGAYADKERLAAYMDKIEAMGHEITHNWTRTEAARMSVEAAVHCAKSDVQGVLNAEILLAVFDQDDYPYKGTRHEVGVALGVNAVANKVAPNATVIEIWIVNNGGDPHTVEPERMPPCMDCCFEYLGHRYFKSIDEAIAHLPKPSPSPRKTMRP